MSNFKKTILYPSYSRTDALNFRVFWISAFFLAAFLLVYIYSVYLTIDLSYGIEKELRLIKSESIAYQQIEEQYINKLESLQDAGRQTLGLAAPKKQSFVERYSAVARAGL
ncbi:MAG: hypothetical protein HYY55_00290 [Candidatus Niyogibacteria bacterium]|nr:MAG: hypothetical protein HYY55_00290 [Candidatus Niyogibacteria bacterium]